MTIGEKIRIARIEKNMTQSDVADDKITRNMISAIESNKAMPSIDTLMHISSRLGLPAAYLISDENDPLTYRKNESIIRIKSAFSSKKYSECIALIEAIGSVDDELAYLLAHSFYETGVMMAKRGSFKSAEENLTRALSYSQMTIYDTDAIECKIPLYMSFLKNVNAPLLEFDIDAFYSFATHNADFEFFRYVCNDVEFKYKNELFQRHIAAKIKMKERKYYEAISILLGISDNKSAFEYNAYVMYGVYSDLDTCYKQILDFENAYKYSVKRISMLEGFNS
jgi:transcriptional regulator with XRE-family HTH domain